MVPTLGTTILWYCDNARAIGDSPVLGITFLGAKFTDTGDLAGGSKSHHQFGTADLVRKLLGVPATNESSSGKQGLANPLRDA